MACAYYIVAGCSSTDVVQLFDTILLEVVFKCDTLCINVCKYHMTNILSA